MLTYCAFVDAYSIAYQWFYLTCSNLRHILLFHLLSTEKIVPRLMINCRNISNQITDSKTISNCGNLLRALLTFIHHYQFCHCFLFSVHRRSGCSISSLRHCTLDSTHWIHFKNMFFFNFFNWKSLDFGENSEILDKQPFVILLISRVNEIKIEFKSNYLSKKNRS